VPTSLEARIGSTAGILDFDSKTRTDNGGTRMKLKPLGDRLIVKAIEEEATTASGIVLPDTAKEKPQKGKVVAVGDGAINEDGRRSSASPSSIALRSKED
jgi:hypothetical protein